MNAADMATRRDISDDILLIIDTAAAPEQLLLY